jgi:hypothetical protein
MENLQLYGFSSSIACLESIGLSIVFMAYADHSAGEPIESIGFNNNSGYVYIALENGVQIASMLGNEPEYIIQDNKTGEELFFNSYNKLMNHIENN